MTSRAGKVRPEDGTANSSPLTSFGQNLETSLFIEHLSFANHYTSTLWCISLVLPANPWGSVFIGPQEPLQISDSVEGLTELSKAVTLTITTYYSERIQIKVRIRKKHVGQSLEKTIHKLSVVLPHRSCTDSYLTQQLCMTACMKYCQPRTLTQDLISRVFIGGQSGRHVVDFSLHPAPWEVKVLPHDSSLPP